MIGLLDDWQIGGSSDDPIDAGGKEAVEQIHMNSACVNIREKNKVAEKNVDIIYSVIYFY